MPLQSVGSFSTGIVANLLVIATATAIASNSLFTQVSTCTATNNAVSLPAIPYLGQSYTVRNDGASYCQVFPPVIAGQTPQINALGNAVAFYVPANGGEVDFMATATNQYYVVRQNQSQLVVPIASTQAITIQHNNATLVCSHAAATVLTLPAPIQGFSCRVVLEALVANIVTVTSTGANVSGTLASTTVTAAQCIGVVCSGVTSVLFTASSPIGCYLDIVSDGTLYYVRGVSSLAAGFTTA